MTPKKIVSIIRMYERGLRNAGIPKVRMDPKLTFAALSKREILSHAHFLCDGANEYAKDPTRTGKTGRHLASIQLCLSFAGWYSLEELMNHNRPKATKMTARK